MKINLKCKVFVGIFIIGICLYSLMLFLIWRFWNVDLLYRSEGYDVYFLLLNCVYINGEYIVYVGYKYLFWGGKVNVRIYC